MTIAFQRGAMRAEAAAMLIAERCLVVNESGAKMPVPIRIFAPVASDAHFLCRYEIGWPEGAWASAVAGVDAVQALHLALQKIGAELYASDHHRAGRLQWSHGRQGYGFPVPRNARDRLIGDDRIFDA